MITLALLPFAALAEPQPAPPQTSASPIVALLGIGVHRQSVGFGARARWKPVLVGMVGYRVRPHVAVGLRTRLSRFTYEWADSILDYDDYEDWNVLTVDVGATAQYTESVFTLAASIGRRLSRSHVVGRHCYKNNCTAEDETNWTNDASVLGLSMSVGGSHSLPIAVFLDVQVPLGGGGPFANSGGNDSDMTTGLAFRW